MWGTAASAPAESRRSWGQIAAMVAAAMLPLVLIAPALWNGYPLLQYDTGGYIARWYEGYLVPSRSTVFGYYLHLGETTRFWLNVKLQALATLWILLCTLRVFGLARPLQMVIVCLALSLTTALPFLSSLLLTDIFAGLAVLSFFLIVVHGETFSRAERCALIVFTAFAAGTHNATLGVLFGLSLCAWIVRPILRERISFAGAVRGSLSVIAGALMLLAANFMMSGKVAWTPGGYGILFGRILQDGIVTRYLDDHCAVEKLKLCPYRHSLPDTGDKFLWGGGAFNELGRFNGLGDEMRHIVINSLIDYPLQNLVSVVTSAARQLAMVATGEGVHNDLMHTHRIIERYLPYQADLMHASRQHRGELHVERWNAIHVPVAWLSMLLLAAWLAHALWRRHSDDLTILAGTVMLALLGNAVICGGLSGPHDRYGSRIVWTASFVLLLIVLRRFEGSTNRS